MKLKIASIFTNKNLILGFLDVAEGSFQETSLSAFFAKQDQRELLSRNFSSIVSLDNNFASDSLSLILEYSKSFIEESENSQMPLQENPREEIFKASKGRTQELFPEAIETVRSGLNDLSKEFDELRLSRIVQLSQKPSKADFSEVRKNLSILNVKAEEKNGEKNLLENQKIFGCGSFLYKSNGTKQKSQNEENQPEKEEQRKKGNSRGRKFRQKSKTANVSNLMDKSDEEEIQEKLAQVTNSKKRGTKAKSSEKSTSEKCIKPKEKRAITKTLETVKRCTTNNLNRNAKREKSRNQQKQVKTGKRHLQKNKNKFAEKVGKKEYKIKKNGTNRRESKDKNPTKKEVESKSRKVSQKRRNTRKLKTNEERSKIRQKKNLLSILGFKTKKQTLKSVLKSHGRQSKYSCQTQKSKINKISTEQ